MIRPAINAAECARLAVIYDRLVTKCIDANQLDLSEWCRVEAAEYERLAMLVDSKRG